MLLTAREETELPMDVAFKKASNFTGMEAFARQKGIVVNRMDGPADTMLGTKWYITANFRGRMRDFELEVVESNPSSKQVVSYATGGVTGKITTLISAKEGGGSVVQMDIDVEAQSLTGRLLLQSLKLARGSLEKQMKRRLQSFLNA